MVSQARGEGGLDKEGRSGGAKRSDSELIWRMKPLDLLRLGVGNEKKKSNMTPTFWTRKTDNKGVLTKIQISCSLQAPT